MKASATACRARHNRELVGRNVEVLRAGQKITKRAFCLMACISRPTLNGIESGLENATVSTLTKVSEALGVEIADLFVERFDG